ncbi:MAG: DUF1343 domain-containing protein, partial [Gemmatimonadota bacterium]
MTLGELALLARHDLAIDASVTVIPAAGWRRAMDFAATGLPFVPPSPNLPTLESLYHYPGLCLFEGTALSVGRGTDAPFSQVGAPWLDTAAVLRRLHAVPGVRFEATTFTPRRPGDGKFPDVTLPGIRLRLLDPARYDPTAAAVELLAAIQRVHPDRIGWNERHFDRLAGGPGLRQQLIAGVEPAAIVRGWAEAVRRFAARRQPFLLYP